MSLEDGGVAVFGLGGVAVFELGGVAVFELGGIVSGDTVDGGLYRSGTCFFSISSDLTTQITRKKKMKTNISGCHSKKLFESTANVT